MKDNFIRFEIENVEIVVRSDLDELLPQLSAHYAKVSESGQPEQTFHVDVRQTSLRFGKPRYSVYGDDVEVGAGLRRNEVSSFVERAISLRMTAARAEFGQPPATSRSLEPKHGRVSHQRRRVLKQGAKLAYVAPAVITLSSQKAFAAGSVLSGMCSAAVQTGGLCDSDSDCCSGNCTIGVCE